MELVTTWSSLHFRIIVRDSFNGRCQWNPHFDHNNLELKLRHIIDFDLRAGFRSNCLDHGISHFNWKRMYCIGLLLFPWFSKSTDFPSITIALCLVLCHMILRLQTGACWWLVQIIQSGCYLMPTSTLLTNRKHIRTMITFYSLPQRVVEGWEGRLPTSVGPEKHV